MGRPEGHHLDGLAPVGIVEQEQEVLTRVLPLLAALQEADARAEAKLVGRERQDFEQWSANRGDAAQREAYEGALADDAIHLRAHAAARRSRELPLGTPYFGRLVLDEAGRRQEVLLGKVGVSELRIVDWRDGPLARLYYDYDEGEEFEETVNQRDREGVVAIKRRVDIQNGFLVEVQARDTVLRRRPDGSYDAPKGRRQVDGDHRLPDIVSLITREQFGIIAKPDAGVVLLRGRAGSGKTTVALHRIAYLHYQDPVRYRADRILVVMFNKALQTYISRVLPDLGVRGVAAETFHGWALRKLRQGGINLPFRATAPAAVARLKRHPAIEALLEAHVEALTNKAAAWLAERGTDVAAGQRLRSRLGDHVKDLATLFDDDALCRRVLPERLHGVIGAAREHATRQVKDGVLDWEDAALLLRIGQIKRRTDPALKCAWAGAYSHVVIDEAQDLSTVEIAVLVDAADAGRSVTIAGDPAQKIMADAQFEGFDGLLERLVGHVAVKLDQLQVGHRSTRPIMALAIRALGKTEDPILDTARDGEPVEWLEGAEAVAAALTAFRAMNPGALVAVLCKRKNTADDWARRLAGLGVVDVRRASRDDFSFLPGVVVSNVHQVKGLEFDGVVLVEPAEYGGTDRLLLHVAITRAADRLWVCAATGRGLL